MKSGCLRLYARNADSPFLHSAAIDAPANQSGSRAGRRAIDDDGAIPGAFRHDLRMIRGRRSGTLTASARDRAGSKKFSNLFDRVPSTWIMFEKPHGLRRVALVIERPWGPKVADYVADAVDLATMRAEVGEQSLVESLPTIQRRRCGRRRSRRRQGVSKSK